MHRGTATKTLVTLVGALALAAPALAQNGETGAAPAVQKVSVKGIAHFGFAKAAINPDDGAKLMTEVRSMKNVTWQTITVSGHTDNIGPVKYNERLSEDRAKAVTAYLLEKGVNPGKIRAAGKGPHEPVASNKTAAGRAQNRRAEIEFLGVQSTAQ